MPLCNSIRHFLFVIPLLFVLGGLSFEALLQGPEKPWATASVCLLAIAPGVLGIVQLHPYEYGYFNSLTVGVGGECRPYDIDYWCSSLKEATM